MELHAVKGVGKDHAKFSLVGAFINLFSPCTRPDIHLLATASYRLLPHIVIKAPIPPNLADKFQKFFSPGVIKIDPHTKAVSIGRA